MKKGLSFDSVQINRTRISIDQTITLSVPILPNPAKTPFMIRNTTPPGTEIALDFSSIKGSEIGREFCFDEAFRGHLCPQGIWKTEQMSGAKGTETFSANLQKITFIQVELIGAFAFSFTNLDQIRGITLRIESID